MRAPVAAAIPVTVPASWFATQSRPPPERHLVRAVSRLVDGDDLPVSVDLRDAPCCLVRRPREAASEGPVRIHEFLQILVAADGTVRVDLEKVTTDYGACPS